MKEHGLLPEILLAPSQFISAAVTLESSPQPRGGVMHDRSAPKTVQEDHISLGRLSGFFWVFLFHEQQVIRRTFRDVSHWLLSHAMKC